MVQSNTTLQRILKACSARSVESKEMIQSLWSSYGEIFRCKLSGSELSSVVVKHVKLPDSTSHPRGWNTSISHSRKVDSYRVEMEWYRNHSQPVDERCRIPRGIHSWVGEGEMLLILEDLNSAGYPVRKRSLTPVEIRQTLSWIAWFHGKNMGDEGKGLWPCGTYWHLETRPDEWSVMENRELKDAARAIDGKLNRAEFQTILHGDAKLANFCYSRDGAGVAAVDFQYAGRGCGMKDVAYFLSSCLDESECEKRESDLLSHYFHELRLALDYYKKSLDFQGLEMEWRNLYKFAWADFYRFLDGWSPGHYKMHDYSEELTRQALKELNH